MKRMKLTSFLLCVLVMLSVFSVSAIAESTAIFFATDVHQKTSNFINILSAVKKDIDIGLVALGGDYEVSVSSLNSCVDTVFPDADRFFTTGNHDDAGSGMQKTGEAYNNEHFAVFVVAYEDFKDLTGYNALKTYLDNYSSNEKTANKPLFVLSHLPLHSQRGDNANANRYAELLNEAGRTIDIVYLWGHNHTRDKTLYFGNRGDSMTPEGGNTMNLNFLYVTAGYIKEGYGLTVQINKDTIVFQRYSTSGKNGSAVTVNRIVPAQPSHDCLQDGHKADRKLLNLQAKAMMFTCTECKRTCYERICGDIDGNGKIETADARLVLRCSVELETLTDADCAAADIDRDNSISTADARSILRKAVGLSDELQWKPIAVDKNGKLIV